MDDGHAPILEEISAVFTTDGSVISYNGANYYRACGIGVRRRTDGTTSHCVRRSNHPGVLHEDYDGDVSTGLDSDEES